MGLMSILLNTVLAQQPPVSGLQLHLDAGLIEGVTDGASLSNGWQDVSGNGYHALPGTAPIYVSNGGGCIPAVRFNGIDQYLQVAMPTGPAATVFMVYANRRDPLLVQHRDTLLSSDAAGAGIHLSSSRYVDGQHIVQFGWDKDSLFNSAYQSQIGADEIIQWNAVDSMDGGTWYNGGTLPSLDDAGVGALLRSPSYGVVMTTRSISSSLSDHTNTVVNSAGDRLGLGPAGGSDIYFRQTEASAWAFDFDRDVELRQIMFDAMGNADDRVRITIEGGSTYVLDRNDCAETSAWSGDGSMEVHTFPVPVFVAAGSDITVAAADSSGASGNAWQLAGVIVGVPDPAPDYPGFVAQEGAGIDVSTRVNGRRTEDAGTDIFRDRYYIGSAVYSQVPGSSALTIGAANGAGGDFGENDIREILVYDHALSDADRRAVLSYLGDKYDIEVIDRSPDHPVEAYNHVLGTQQIGRQYTFGESGIQVLDAARAHYRQGSRVFKLAISNKYAYQNGVQDDPNITSLTEVVRDVEGIRSVLDMPFTDILFWANTFSVPSWGQVATDTGLDAATEQLIYDEFYELTEYLLTNYTDSGKSFYLGNWEGDWLLAGEGSQDPENDITVAKINGMIDWATVRQQAVDDAKAAVAHTNVNVWYYLEMNRGDWAVDGRPCVVKSVMPSLTNLDFVSFSAYTTKNKTEAQVHQMLDTIHNALPSHPTLTGCRLMIGEHGYGRGTDSRETQAFKHRDTMRHCFTWAGGPPRFILHWEFFWNELNTGTGLYMDMHHISEDNERHPIYYLHENFYRDMRRWVEDYYATNGSVPSASVYAAQAVQTLDNISLVEYEPCLDILYTTPLIQFGGAVDSITNPNWQAQIGAEQIIQWNGVNSWGGGFNANGSVGGTSGRGIGAALWSSNSALTLTTRDISSTLPGGTNTYSSGTPNVLGVTGGDNAKFDAQYDEEWTFDFDADVVLKKLILTALEFSGETIEVTIGGFYTNTFVRADCDPVSWEPSANRFVYTFSGGGLSVPAGTDIRLGATSTGVWGLQGVVVEAFTTNVPVFNYDAWAAGWVVDIGDPTNDYDLDGVLNIYEFGLGGNPTNAADGGLPQSYEMVSLGGSNMMIYVYPQRHDPDSGLSYYLVTDTDLLEAPGWTNTGYQVDGTNITGGTFDYVTNMVPMDVDEKFIKLIID
jgi:hypothetical protein